MKKIYFILFFMGINILAVCGQENYRFSYLMMQKESPEDKSFYVNEMKLDFDGRTSFFYSEKAYLRDSLNVLAFNKNGEIVNQDIYGELTRISNSSTKDMSVIDFSKAAMSQFYHDVAFFDGKMPLELPQWTFTETEEEQSGYHCKVAKGLYLGREWTIWFTDDIPVNVGPWFLWGAPGLIVYAVDSENIFNFRLLGVEKIDRSRLERSLSYLKTEKIRPRSKVYSMPMKDMEIMHSRYMRDVVYFNKIHGIIGSYIEDRNGNRIETELTRPYIPYIPDGYWKSK